MTRGNPTKQTIATEKYGKKAGWVNKSYKLKKTLVEEFAEACQSAGVSQAAKLSEFMRKFIDSQK